MITITESVPEGFAVRFLYQGEPCPEDFPEYAGRLFAGNYLETLFLPCGQNRATLYVGLGGRPPGIRETKEAATRAARELKERGVSVYAMDVFLFVHSLGLSALREIVQGIYQGNYEITLTRGEDKDFGTVRLTGIDPNLREDAQRELLKGLNLAKALVWAMDLVNAPGNLLRPMDFARAVMERMENLPVACELLVYSKLNDIGMKLLTSIGGSSENPPCFLILRYRGGEPDGEVTGLAGKGVTCDTGGYCLKSASSMEGIKGDMAGGVSVAAAILAMASNGVRANVTGFIPMCENRIAPVSLVPGDVITSYGGKRVEICNTDAEGRLILADAVTYAVRDEKVDRVVDIATLTGSVVSMLGFSTAGALCDSEEFYERFERAAWDGGERYWRLPIYEEQEKMIESEIADIKNMGEDYCNTITAGLFIRSFAEGKPWLHLDIAGTAWLKKPLYAGQPKWATGAGMTSLYYLFEERK